MPTTRVLTPPTSEPVSLALFNAHARLDLDMVGQDAAVVAQRELAELLIRAAREKVEAYTGRYFAPQTLEITYELSDAYVLPLGATATGVSGFYTDLQALQNASSFLEEYRKGISVNRQLDWPYPALAQTYTVTATTTGDTQFLNVAKAAILELAAEWYKNRESTIVGTIAPELPVAWKVKLAQAVVTPLGY